jgi:hypothetical protein
MLIPSNWYQTCEWKKINWIFIFESIHARWDGKIFRFEYNYQENHN